MEATIMGFIGIRVSGLGFGVEGLGVQGLGIRTD